MYATEFSAGDYYKAQYGTYVLQYGTRYKTLQGMACATISTMPYKTVRGTRYMLQNGTLRKQHMLQRTWYGTCLRGHVYVARYSTCCKVWYFLQYGTYYKTVHTKRYILQNCTSQNVT